MAEVLFIDWLKTVFIPSNATLWRKFQYEGPILLLLEGRATHVTVRVLVEAASERIIIIRLVTHSSCLSQPSDRYVFGIFRTFSKKENKSTK
jgi:hypothetical protein